MFGINLHVGQTRNSFRLHTIRRLRYETRSCCFLSQCGHAHMAAFIFCTQRKPNCMNVYKWPLDQQIGTRRMQLVASFKAAPRLSRRTATLSNWPEVMATSSRLSIAGQCSFLFLLLKVDGHYCWPSSHWRNRHRIKKSIIKSTSHYYTITMVVVMAKFVSRPSNIHRGPVLTFLFIFQLMGI